MATPSQPKPDTLRRRRFAGALFVAAAASLLTTACGFRIRGFDLQLPFKSIAIQGSSDIVNEVRQAILGQPGIKVVDKLIEADVILNVTTPTIERIVVAFSSAGRPREIQLRMRVVYRLTDRYLTELGPPQELAQYRDINVSESEVLSQAGAESFMINDMHRDFAQQILRRLRSVQLPSH